MHIMHTGAPYMHRAASRGFVLASVRCYSEARPETI